VEYLPRSQHIMETVFPALRASASRAGLRTYHVVGGGGYYQHYPAWAETVALAGEPPPPPAGVIQDDSIAALRAWKAEQVFVGSHNRPDCDRGFKAMTDFPAPARPAPGEAICKDAHQLTAVCQRDGVNHLIYCGFAINWCLLKSPGGMIDMSRRGAFCSAIREGVTAVENRESARTESHKEAALWRVALAFGFVFADADLRATLDALPAP